MKKLRTKIFISYWMIAILTFTVGLCAFPTLITEDFYVGGKEKLLQMTDRVFDLLELQEQNDSDLPLELLPEFLFQLADFDPYTELVLFDHNGQMLAQQQVAKHNKFFNQGFIEETDFVAKTFKAQEIQEVKYDGRVYFAYTRPYMSQMLPGVEYIGFVKTLDFYYSSIGGTIKIILLMVMFVALISIFVGIFMAKAIVKPISELESYAIAIGSGQHLDFEPSHVATEINSLGENMQKMETQLLAASARQKNYFGSASHELKTPLMIIQGYSEGISAGVVQNVPQAAQAITNESKKINSIVEQLLLLSKIEDSVLQTNLEPVNLHEFMESLLDSLYGLEKPLVYRCAEQFKTMQVLADEELLHQAIMNPLANALRHAKTEVKVTLDCVDNLAVIRISDDGGGMTQADIELIFDRFYKGENGKTGLGMSIVKSAVERMEGTAQVQNGKKGLIVEISIPLVQE